MDNNGKRRFMHYFKPPCERIRGKNGGISLDCFEHFLQWLCLNGVRPVWRADIDIHDYTVTITVYADPILLELLELSGDDITTLLHEDFSQSVRAIRSEDKYSMKHLEMHCIEKPMPFLGKIKLKKIANEKD